MRKKNLIAQITNQLINTITQRVTRSDVIVNDSIITCFKLQEARCNLAIIIYFYLEIKSGDKGSGYGLFEIAPKVQDIL